jgi:aryl-alcohol dehydrogenase-like predicted oxidoreductase
LAWAIANTDVTTALLGFTKIEQVDENLKAVELLKKWTPEIEKRINEIFNNDPEADMDFRKWGDMASRRSVALIKNNL